MYSQIYSGLSLISAILRNFRVAGENESIARRARMDLFSLFGQISIFLSSRSKKSHFRTSF